MLGFDWSIAALGIVATAVVCGTAAVRSETTKDITVLQFGALIDGTGERLTATDIAVADGKILKVGKELSAQYPKARRLDQTHLTGLPGLIDAHVHITYALSAPHNGRAWQTLGQTPASKLLTGAVRNACKTLQTGVTSARDLFSADLVSHHLRALIDDGIVEGPRLFLSGVGMHPSTVENYGSDDAEIRLASIQSLVAGRIADGSDWLKIFATTGSADDLTGKATFSDTELTTAIKAAHQGGLRVAVHSYSDAAVGAALAAGAESLDHPVRVAPETLAAWAQTDTYYVPTIDHNRYYADYRAEYGYAADIEENLRSFVQVNLDTLKAAHAAGVKIAFGSDAVMSMFGENTRELEWFVEGGLTAAETIQAATVNGADLMGQSEELGRLVAGYKADIIGIEGDPLSDITALTRGVRFVMTRGKPVSDACNGSR